MQVQIHETRRSRLDDQPLAADRTDEPPPYSELAHQLLEVTHRLRLHRDHHPRRPLPEERQVRALPDRPHVHVGAHRPRPAHAALRQGYRQPPLRAIVGGGEQPRADRGATGLLHRPLHHQVERGQAAGDLALAQPQQLRPAQADRLRSQQRHPVARRREPLGAARLRIVQDTRHPDHRSGKDRLTQGLIVEGDVAAHHGDFERTARVGEPRDRLLELPQDLRALGRAEVEAIGETERAGAADREVAGRFGHRHGGAGPRIEVHEARVAVGG